MFIFMTFIKLKVLVSFGTGLPVMISNYIPENISIFVHADPGILGLGPYPDETDIDFDLINAAGEPSTSVPGASVFTGEESFNMIRRFVQLVLVFFIIFR